KGRMVASSSARACPDRVTVKGTGSGLTVITPAGCAMGICPPPAGPFCAITELAIKTQLIVQAIKNFIIRFSAKCFSLKLFQAKSTSREYLIQFCVNNLSRWKLLIRQAEIQAVFNDAVNA